MRTLIDRIKAVQRSSPVDVSGLAEHLGVEVNYVLLEPTISGELVREGDSYAININARDASTRQRFTLAHELGHYIYHRDLIGKGLDDDRAYRSTMNGRYFNTRIGPRQETEANKFAANLLMPWSLIEDMQRNGLDSRQIADQLRVSEQAMAIRLGELSAS